jgi:hypothetical protein
MTSIAALSASVTLVILFILSSDGFYLPGLAPNVYCRKSIDAKCKVNESVETIHTIAMFV